MSLLTQSQIKTALIKLGELAAKDGLKIQLVLLGGAVMALQYNARSATKDIDVIIYAPEQRTVVWKLASLVAADIGLPEGGSMTPRKAMFPALRLVKPSWNQTALLLLLQYLRRCWQ